MSSPTWETHISIDMCSLTWETRIPSDMCFLTWETHIPSDICSPTCVLQLHVNGRMAGSFYVSVKLTTYPSPKPTLTLSSYLRQNVGLGEG